MARHVFWLCYNGLVWHNDRLWMAYNAVSREAGRSSIYFAQIDLQ